MRLGQRYRSRAGRRLVPVGQPVPPLLEQVLLVLTVRPLLGHRPTPPLSRGRTLQRPHLTDQVIQSGRDIRTVLLARLGARVEHVPVMTLEIGRRRRRPHSHIRPHRRDRRRQARRRRNQSIRRRVVKHHRLVIRPQIILARTHNNPQGPDQDRTRATRTTAGRPVTLYAHNGPAASMSTRRRHPG